VLYFVAQFPRFADRDEFLAFATAPDTCRHCLALTD